MKLPGRLRRKTPRLDGGARREDILRSALPLFAQRGFHGVSTKEIAAAAGISEALIFKHFPTKRAIYRGLYEYCLRSAELDPERIDKLPVETASAARLLYFVLRSVLIMPEHEDAFPAYRLFCHSCLDDGEFARLLLGGTAVRRVLTKFDACIASGRRRGEIANTGAPPSRLFWMARNTASQVCLHHLPRRPALRYEAPPRVLLQEIAVFAFRGLGFNEATLRRFGTARCFRRWEADPELTLLRRKT